MDDLPMELNITGQVLKLIGTATSGSRSGYQHIQKENMHGRKKYKTADNYIYTAIIGFRE